MTWRETGAAGTEKNRNKKIRSDELTNSRQRFLKIEKSSLHRATGLVTALATLQKLSGACDGKLLPVDRQRKDGLQGQSQGGSSARCTNCKSILHLTSAIDGRMTSWNHWANSWRESVGGQKLAVNVRRLFFSFWESSLALRTLCFETISSLSRSLATQLEAFLPSFVRNAYFTGFTGGATAKHNWNTIITVVQHFLLRSIILLQFIQVPVFNVFKKLFLLFNLIWFFWVFKYYLI